MTTDAALIAQVSAFADDLVARRRLPLSTYRVQFSGAFTFRDAEALVPYLHDLGVTDLYASPILRAAPGSTHGYDVCDPTQLNPELGTREDFERLSAALKAHDMGLILDIVPNHMGIAGDCNPWWLDVLENGESSPYARFFDIDWQPVKPELAGKVLLPVLGEPYGEALEGGCFRLAFVEGALVVWLYDSVRLPLAPRTYTPVLTWVLNALPDPQREDALELQSILTAIGYLPTRDEQDAERIAERRREKEIIKRRLAALTSSSTAVQTALDAALTTVNGTPGSPRSFDALDALLAAQPYRLAFWRVAAEEINYRRFFDVNTMAAVRNEAPDVFEAAHALVFALLADGYVTGLRIDHPDGLWDPTAYFRQLQVGYVGACFRRAFPDADADAVPAAAAAWFDARPADAPLPLYVIGEKILVGAEPLPQTWALHGTTGYDFMHETNSVLVERANEAAFSRLYADFSGVSTPYRALEVAMKQKIMNESLTSEISSLAHQLERIGERSRYYRDFTLNGLRAALTEVIASFTVYRTYIREDTVDERDRRFIEAAVRAARRRSPGIPRAVFDFIRDTLLFANLKRFMPDDQDHVRRWVYRFQQMTGPVMAKSVEDTTFYVYLRLTSLNEVGGTPEVFGMSVERFHERQRARHAQWPYAMLALSTHDTKRSEDVRARLNVLSEMPERWSRAVSEWHTLSAAHRQTDDEGTPLPSNNDAYLFYQALLGVFPHEGEAKEGDSWTALVERLVAYMAKATHEAKTYTSWTNPDAQYDAAVEAFVRGLMGDAVFIERFSAFADEIAALGRWNALAQTVLKLTVPGVPDTYRGTEIWDYSLVDPDNRRPVDYERLRALVTELDDGQRDRLALCDALVSHAHDGRIKLYTALTTLATRREHAALFRTGAYVALTVDGQAADHTLAFARVDGASAALVVVPRLLYTLTGSTRSPLGAVWGETRVVLTEALRGRKWRNAYTGETLDGHGDEDTLALGRILRHFPVGLLLAN